MSDRARRWRRVVVAAAIAAVAAAIAPALARVGGGQDYSGGGDSGFGGGGDGGGALVYMLFRLLLWLVIEHPLIGIPVVIIVIVILVRSGGAGLLAGGGAATVLVAPSPRRVVRPPGAASRPDLSALLASDPNFSEPLFVDFVQLVYARAQESIGRRRDDLMAAWLSPEAAASLAARSGGVREVRDVIFGMTRIVGARRQGFFDVVQVDLETNLTEAREAGASQIVSRERWSFRRRAGTVSPGPERMRSLGCVGCGSTLEPKPDGSCPSCGGPRRGGLSQWEAAAILVLDRRPLEPPAVRPGGGVEPGTGFPTVVDPELPAMRRRFDARHPDHVWTEFDRRAREIFVVLQEAWSEGRWERARPHESDALFQVHRFWIERYRRFGMRNRVEKVNVTRTDLAKIGFDAFHESVTLRIFASALDWTEDAEGRVIGGDRDRTRSFSEYWTFLRSIGAQRRQGTSGASCPSCGGPLDAINMAGVCAYCGSKITTGAFDWVVSRIEQDDAYAG